MNGGDVLLDTNAVIAWIKQDRDFAHRISEFAIVSISLFTLGELYFGAVKSSNPARNKTVIDSAKKSFGLILPSDQTGERYAELRFALRKKGRPIPENDIWIAAIALEKELPLMTRDAHFKEVSGLMVHTW